MPVAMVGLLLGLLLAVLPNGTASAHPGDDIAVASAVDAVHAQTADRAPFTLRIVPDHVDVTEVSVRWQIDGPPDSSDYVGFTTASRVEGSQDFAFTADLRSVAEGQHDVFVLAHWPAGTGEETYASAWTSVFMDQHRPVVDLAADPTTWIYPVRDGYRDSTVLRARSGESATGRLVIRSEATGRAVRIATFPESSMAGSFRWWGTDGAGARVPYGWYAATMTYADGGGSTGSDTVRINVRPGTASWSTWTRTLAPRESYKSAWAGNCSRLVSDVNGWPGGYGLWSNSRCDGRNERALVQVVFGSAVPTRGVVAYGDFSVSTRGRADASRPRSVATVELYRSSDHSYPLTSTLPATYGAHAARPLQGRTAVLPGGHVRWRASAVGGNRWDAQSFTVRLRIQVLR